LCSACVRCACVRGRTVTTCVPPVCFRSTTISPRWRPSSRTCLSVLTRARRATSPRRTLPSGPPTSPSWTRWDSLRCTLRNACSTQRSACSTPVCSARSLPVRVLCDRPASGSPICVPRHPPLRETTHAPLSTKSFPLHGVPLTPPPTGPYAAVLIRVPSGRRGAPHPVRRDRHGSTRRLASLLSPWWWCVVFLQAPVLPCSFLRFSL
jgi:hypothetical protein